MLWHLVRYCSNAVIVASLKYTQMQAILFCCCLFFYFFVLVLNIWVPWPVTTKLCRIIRNGHNFKNYVPKFVIFSIKYVNKKNCQTLDNLWLWSWIYPGWNNILTIRKQHCKPQMLTSCGVACILSSTGKIFTEVLTSFVLVFLCHFKQTLLLAHACATLLGAEFHTSRVTVAMCSSVIFRFVYAVTGHCF